MTDLTEKWKAGELDNGLYYVGNGKITDIGFFKKKTIEVYTLDSNIPKMLKLDAEILDKVPSYDELQDMKEYLDYSIKNRYQLTTQINSLIDKIDEEKKENARLKELIKECQEIIEWYKADCGYKDLPTESVLTKINEVLR